MSAGHRHPLHNLRDPQELRRLLTRGGAPELMQRWQKVDKDHDIPGIAGYNVPGTITYVDRDFVRALFDPEYATHLIDEPIETGLAPQAVLDCILLCERDEKVLLDADNEIEHYAQARDLATLAKHERIRQLGGTVLAFERGMRKIVEWSLHKDLSKVPHDLACASYLDDGHSEINNDILRRLGRHGVIDAHKVPKEDVDYSKSISDDKCFRCTKWAGHPQQDLTLCHDVEGLVRADRWCERYKLNPGAPLARAARARPLDFSAHGRWRSTRLQRSL